ncbi:hypothetical protein ACF0H5_023749 [Mactra antiquata]
MIQGVLSVGVNKEEFLDFFECLGLQNHPYVIETLNQMLLEEIVLLPNNEAIEKQTDQQTDNLPEVIQSPKEHTFDSSTTEELFEPWSPGFQVAALREEDIVSASFECIQDGEFRNGKKFFCTHCRQYFYGSVNFRLHRETRHPIKERTVEMGSQLPGPSSENVNTSTHPTEAEIQSSSQEDASPILQTGAGERPYTIKHTGTRTFSKTAATEFTFKVKFNDQWQGRRLVDIRDQLHHMFSDLLARARQDIQNDDLLNIIVRHPALNHAIVIPLTRSTDLTIQKILDKIESVLQSEESLNIIDTFQVIAGALRIPRGTGRVRLFKVTGPDNSIHKKRSMVQIINPDQLCMERAIGVVYGTDAPSATPIGP